MSLEFTDQNFNEEVLSSDKPVLVDFWAEWCGPCRMMGPVVDDLAKATEGVFKVGKVNVDKNPEVTSKYGIMSIPSIKIFKNGQVVKEFNGVQDADSLKSALESAK